MLRFMIRRLLWAVFLFIAVTLVTYVIFFLAPANPERIICGGERARTECLEQARQELALPIRCCYANAPGSSWRPAIPDPGTRSRSPCSLYASPSMR